MGKCGMLSFLWWCATVPAGAQPPDDLSVVPPNIELALRSRLATEWGVEPSKLVLDYGRLPDSMTNVSMADLRYSNRGGRLLITLESQDGKRTTSTGRAGVLVRVPVANRLMRPGDTLDPGAFRWEEETAWGPPVARSDTATSGYLVRGRIVAGQRITSTLAIRPPAIRAGSGITLQWSNASILVEMDGLALGTGYIGDTIPVRRRGVGERVYATIIGSGTAQLRER